MPCDTIQTSKVELTVQTDRDLLNAAIVALGAQPMQIGNELCFIVPGDYFRNRITKDNQLICRNPEIADRLKVAYSTEAVKKAAKVFGWNLQKSNTSATQFTATRRS